MNKLTNKILIILLFSLTSCNICYLITNDSMCKVKKETFKEKEILDFIDTLIKNNKNYYFLIKSSKYFNKEYSRIFDDKTLMYFLEDCNKNGNYYSRKFIFAKTELYKIENRFDRPRYPFEKSEEYKEIDKIANIFINDNISDECLIFTFCLKNGTWYIRGISFEGRQIDGELE